MTTTDQTAAENSNIWVVIDVGCHECGVRSEEVGLYPTKEAAQQAADERDSQTKRWRDGGQTFCQIFGPMEISHD